MKPLPDLNVGRWLAREEDDDEGGPPRILWARNHRSVGDEVQATWASVLVCADVVDIEELEPVLAAAKRMRDLLYAKAVAMGCVAEAPADICPICGGREVLDDSFGNEEPCPECGGEE